MMNHYSLRLVLGLALLCVPASDRVRAQDASRNPCTEAAPIIDLADDWAARLRAGQLRGETQLSALTIRRPSQELRTACPDTAHQFAPALQPLPLRVRTTYNSAYPLDVNNGAMWAGRGLAGAISGGIAVRAGPFSAALYPTAAYQQNREFVMVPITIEGYSPFSYAGHVIDWPQRHGDASYWTLDPGQSYVRIDAFGFATGISTENLWLGPAQRMPLLLGTSAPGFPHFFLATSRPLNIYIGRIEAQIISGRLSESDFFDNNDDNDARLLAGLSAVFEPAFARGLFLGANRMYLTGFEEWDPAAILIDPYLNVRDNPLSDNQLLSLYGRWVLPTAGFEAYAEWAREDHWGSWKDLLLEPDHSQVYLLGFQKTGALRGAQLRWFGELAHLQGALPLRAARGVTTFYTHGTLTQGYTHGGQLLGAWIGPGSDAQLLGVERSARGRVTALSIERVRFDDDAYYNQWGRTYGQNGHDVSLGATLRHTEPVGPFTAQGFIGIARRHNRNAAYFDGTHPGNFRSETNVQLDLDLRWVPRW